MILTGSYPPIFAVQVEELRAAAVATKKGDTPELSEARLRGYVRGRFDTELEALPFPLFQDVLSWARRENEP